MAAATRARVWILAFVAALAGCRAEVATSRGTVRLAPSERVVLGEVRFEYEAWTRQDPAFLERARAQEPGWAQRLRAGYEARAAARGLTGGAGAEVALTIAVTDLDPGSAVGRLLLKADSARGVAYAVATCAGRGELHAGATLADDTLDGIGGALEQLGAAIADGIADSPMTPLGEAAPAPR